jgi:type II secretory pathway component PulJ
MNKTASTPKRIVKVSAGFSLLETMVSVFILTLIVGTIFRQIQKAQTHYRAESQKLDFTEQQRSFLDEFTRDLHQAGYPTAYSNPNGAASPVVTIVPAPPAIGTSLTMEGDLDGTGVQVVTYDYNAANLTLERTAAPKGAVGAPVVAVQNVLAPTANQPLFKAYDAAGNSPPVVGPVKAIMITFTTQGAHDASGKTIQTTMTATARLPNF